MPLLEKLFGFDARTMTVRTELVAGLTTFMTMCYILAVNPAILSATGMDRGALFTATALASPSPPSCWPSWPSCPSPKLRRWV